jgi:putative NADH-flavin reductase
MKVALVSATGNVGSRILAELLKRGHEVTDIVLYPEKLQPYDGLVAQRGNINDEAGLARLLADHGAVISAVRFQSISGQMLPIDNDMQKLAHRL